MEQFTITLGHVYNVERSKANALRLLCLDDPELSNAFYKQFDASDNMPENDILIERLDEFIKRMKLHVIDEKYYVVNEHGRVTVSCDYVIQRD